MTTSVSSVAMQGGTVLWKDRLPVPIEAKWNDVWLTVTPIWAVLASCRVVFYALERIRYPAVVPPVAADAVQALLLWPVAVLGCYVTISMWRQRGFSRAAVVALLSTLVFGLLSRPAYAIGSMLNSPDGAARQWLDSFHATSPLNPASCIHGFPTRWNTVSCTCPAWL